MCKSHGYLNVVSQLSRRSAKLSQLVADRWENISQIAYNPWFSPVISALNSQHSSRWFSPSQGFNRHIDPNLRSWLSDESSLTKRLKQHCNGQFSVEVVATQWVRPERSEAPLLHIPSYQRVMLREVYLKCSNKPVVYARSVIPLSTLQGKHRRLKYLGNKPLGEYLFAHPGLRRKALQWSCLSSNMRLYKTAMSDIRHESQPIWGRRSLFCLGKSPLLVSEFFLPGLFSLNASAVNVADA